MIRKVLLLLILMAGFAVAQNRVYELRTYTCNEGKLEALKARFRDHTIEIFNRHHMESIGYWVPQDAREIEDHADLHSGAPQPGRGRQELERIQRRPGMEEGLGGIRSQRQDRATMSESVFMDPADFSKAEITWTSRARRTCATWSNSCRSWRPACAKAAAPARIDKQHRAGKMTARERIAALLDPGAMFLEIGLLIAYDRYDGQAPAAGVVTGLGKIEGRPAVIVANDATVKAGAWWPETITKILRAQEIAMRNRLPIVYLVDSAGVNLPYQDGIFPGQYGAGRIFYYNSLMRPQAAHSADRRGDGSVHRGRRVSAGAERRHHHGGGHQLHGAGRAEPGEGRDRAGDRFRTAGRRADAHRGQRRGALHGEGRCRLPGAHPAAIPRSCREPPAAPAASRKPPARDAAEIYGVLPADHRLPYDIEEVIFRDFRCAPITWNFSPSTRRKCCAPMRGLRGIRWRSSPTAADF